MLARASCLPYWWDESLVEVLLVGVMGGDVIGYACYYNHGYQKENGGQNKCIAAEPGKKPGRGSALKKLQPPMYC
jgi:hypothetical protein